MAFRKLPDCCLWTGILSLMLGVPASATCQVQEPLPPPRLHEAPLPFPTPVQDTAQAKSAVQRKSTLFGRPVESAPAAGDKTLPPGLEPLFQTDFDPPLGFAGPSGI